jgi:hypothetical protein
MYQPAEYIRAAGTPRLKVERRSDGGAREQYDEWLAAQIFTVLLDHFPGHFWQVQVRSEQGIARIRIPVLMGDTLGYTLHLDRLANDPGYKAVKEAAGEILERWRIPRGAFSLAHFLEAKRDRAVRRANGPVPV